MTNRSTSCWACNILTTLDCKTVFRCVTVAWSVLLPGLQSSVPSSLVSPVFNCFHPQSLLLLVTQSRLSLCWIACPSSHSLCLSRACLDFWIYTFPFIQLWGMFSSAIKACFLLNYSASSVLHLCPLSRESQQSQQHWVLGGMTKPTISVLIKPKSRKMFCF